MQHWHYLRLVRIENCFFFVYSIITFYFANKIIFGTRNTPDDVQKNTARRLGLNKFRVRKKIYLKSSLLIGYLFNG